MSNITSRLSFTRTLGSTVMLGIMLFLSLPAATYAVDIIIDNRGPGMSFSNPPGWHVKTMASAYKGDTLRTYNKGAWSTFKFGSLASGTYDVYMHWPDGTGLTLPDNAAPVIIKHSSGTQTVTVNQQQNGGRWNRLGRWTLNNTAYLTLTNRGNVNIYSDAVKLVPLLVTPPQDPTLSLTANPVQVGTGGAATLSWASQHTTSCTASAGWSGSKGTSGSQTVNNITSSQTYNLTCAGTTTSVSKTVKVAVISTPPLVQPVVVGLNVNQFLGGSFDTAGQAFTQELGTHSIRVSYKHGDHDFAVNWAAQRGIGVLFFLGYSQGCNPTTPEGRQCYANRSANLAQTYGDKVQYYEVWNEWNGGLGLGGGWPACFPTCKDAVMYTDLLCRTYKAIKAVRPSAKVVGGVTAGTHTDFIRRMLDAGAGNCMDVVSVHPYVYHIGTSEFRVPSVDSPASVGADKFIEAITATHNLVKQKTGKAMPVIVTEEGRHTGNSAASEQLTANYLTELYNRAESVPFLDGIWWFGLEDGAESVGTTGLVRSNNTKKPAFAAFQAAANR